MVKYVRTEVKCHSCSRVCGEVDGRPPGWVLFRVARVLPASDCGVSSNADVRCSRCGGRVYPDETYTRAGDARASRVAGPYRPRSRTAA